MNRFPLFLDLATRKTVIVGGGAAAMRKARLVIGAGGSPVIIAAVIEQTVREELNDHASFVERAPRKKDFADATLVFIAIDDVDDADRLAALARNGGALVNVVDRPALCDFTTPSIIDRGPIAIAISTDGAAPVFGRKLRADIEALLPKRAGALVTFAAQYREAVKAQFPEAERRAFWEGFFDGPIAAQFIAGDETGAHEAMLSVINREKPQPEKGVVHIVGAGPGDPELLTLKAFRLIQNADVILYDRLIGDGILELARRDADRIYVGKSKSNHAVPQNEIEARMIALAQAGKMVVRLKGGDPFVFGRGGEELESLRAAGVPTYVTPGITAATGCAAAAGMALTHRDHAQSVTFVTGHAKENEDPDLDWASLAALKNTLVVYMGVSKAGQIASKLLTHGRGGATPVAVIENGARDDQIIAKGVLQNLEAVIEDNGIKGPALLVIGEVAALADGDALNVITQQEKRAA